MVKISEIVHKRFDRGFMGYDVRQVDLLLDEVIRELEQRDEEEAEMRRKLKVAAHRIALLEKIIRGADALEDELNAIEKEAAEGRLRMEGNMTGELPMPDGTPCRTDRSEENVRYGFPKELPFLREPDFAKDMQAAETPDKGESAARHVFVGRRELNQRKRELPSARKEEETK